MSIYKTFQLFSNRLRINANIHGPILGYSLLVSVLLAFYFELSFIKSLPLVDQKYIWNWLKDCLQNYLLSKPIRQFDPEILRPLTVRLYWSLGGFFIYPLTLLFSLLKRQSRPADPVSAESPVISEKTLVTLSRKLVDKSSLAINPRIKIPQKFEIDGFLIGGTVNVGKTVLLSNIISQIRARQQRALIYDVTGGQYLSYFYDPEIDHIYNPFDERSLYWNLFESVETITDYNRLAASIIPAKSGAEGFLVETARQILSVIFQICATADRADIQYVNRLLNMSPHDLYQSINSFNPRVGNYMISPESGRTQNVLSTLYKYTNCFRYMENLLKQKPFSLREWTNSAESGFIFLNNSRKNQEGLRGCFTFFINAFINEVLDLPESLDRRIFLFIDPLSTLHRLNGIENLFILGRQRGVSTWIGLQEIVPIEQLYDPQTARSIINKCHSKILFRINDLQSAAYLAGTLEEPESRRKNEHGSEPPPPTPTVMPSEIVHLPDLTCYLKFAGLLVTRTSIPHHSYPPIAEGFVKNPYFLAR